MPFFLHSLHRSDCTATTLLKGDRLVVITHDPSVISATLETVISVAAAFRAPVFPVLEPKFSYYIHWLIHFCEGTFLATKTQVFSHSKSSGIFTSPKMSNTPICGYTVPPKSSKTRVGSGGWGGPI